jgi:hypothetical protein
VTPEVFLGKTVVDGKVQFWSVSSLEKGDTSREGCLRKWHFRYVIGIKEPEKPWLKAGDVFHKEAEDYLRTGNRAACSPLLLSGLHLMPTPGPDLLLEYPLPLERIGGSVVTIDGKPRIVGGKLVGKFNIVGIPVTGKIDCVESRGTYLNEEGELCDDAPNTIGVNDWKTGSDDRYHKTKHQLPESLQMIGYGAFVGGAANADFVRLTHVFFNKKKREARRSTIAVPREQIEERFTRLDRVARALVQVACESDPLKVDANTNVCSAYGGCPYRGECPASRDKTLIDMFGPGAGRDRKELTMSLDLIARLQQQSAAASPPSALATLTAPAAPAVPPGFAEAIRTLNSLPSGRPALAGAAAEAYAAMINQTWKTGQGYAGTGELGKYTSDSVEQIIAIAAEVAKSAPAAPAAPAPLPPDAPVSDPAKAAALVEGELPPGVVNPPPVEEKKKRGKKAAAPAPVLPVAASGNAATVAPVAAPAPTQAATMEFRYAPVSSAPVPVSGTEKPNSGLQVFVDCIVNQQLPSLDSMVDGCVAKLQELGGVADIRIAPNDNPLGFGKWKAALALAMKEEAAKLAPGAYVMSGYGEIRATAAEALSSVATLFVRGGR